MQCYNPDVNDFMSKMVLGGDIIRICVIGCGDIAHAAHGPALQRLAHKGICKLVGCCARHMENAEAFKHKFGFENAYDNYSFMLDEQKPDLVFILVPVKGICNCAVEVMRMGYPVTIEKPPGVSKEETDIMSATAEEMRLFNAVMFNRRSMPLVEETKRLISMDKIDAISLEMCRYRRIDEDFTTTAIHGIDCLSFLAGSLYEQISFHYEHDEQRHNTNYYAKGFFENGIYFDMRFLPDAGAVTERITIYASGKQYYLDLPVWSGTEYTPGFDYPGKLVCADAQQRTVEILGTDLSHCGDGYVLNGFYNEDKRLIMALKNCEPSPFAIVSGRQSVEISALMRAGAADKTWRNDIHGK